MAKNTERNLWCDGDKAVAIKQRYPLEELFGEFMEFFEDYSMAPVLK